MDVQMKSLLVCNQWLQRYIYIWKMVLAVPGRGWCVLGLCFDCGDCGHYVVQEVASSFCGCAVGGFNGRYCYRD